jgi:small subunit ribosomal protein S9
MNMTTPVLGQLLRSASRAARKPNHTSRASIPRIPWQCCFATTPRYQVDEQGLSDYRLTSSDQPDFAAAPELPEKSNVDLNSTEYGREDVDDHKVPLMKRIRIIPDSPSYFSARPKFTDAYLRVEEQYLKWKALPRTEHVPHILWHDFDSLKAQTGNEPISQTRYRTLIKMLKELSAIEPILMPPQVTELLQGFKRAHQPALIKPREFDVDEWGRSLGVGKRKESTAKAYLVMGEGEVMVNGKSLTQHFGRLHDRESALWPLKITERLDKYNVFAVVGGGGVTGQAEAMTLAVARALLVHEPALHHRLLEGTFLSRILHSSVSVGYHDETDIGFHMNPGAVRGNPSNPLLSFIPSGSSLLSVLF